MDDVTSTAPGGATWRTSTRIPPNPAVLREERQRLIADMTAHHLPPETAYDASLVMAELTTNAICHGAPLEDGRIAVSWGARDGLVHVEVTDAGGSAAPATRPVVPDPEHAPATHGRGLAIVDALARAWGVRRDQGEATVWASLPTGT